MQFPRSCGVLTHISSLPGKYGIGTMGKEAEAFVGWLSAAGQTYWQILPIGPTGFGDSPYQSFSAFAGNPYFIDPDGLGEAGFVTAEELREAEYHGDPAAVDYGWLFESRRTLFCRAMSRFFAAPPTDFEEFCAKEDWWLGNYTLFMAVKDAHDGLPYLRWEAELRRRDPAALQMWRVKCAEGVRYYQMLQYLFYTQWKRFKQYANDHGIQLIGDIPIYVAPDSADVWANPHLFLLNDEEKPTQVAGCPPDLFSADGQLWGNPLYDWAAMQRDGYRFWLARLAACLRLHDVVRIDHFRAFADYYCIPATDDTARNGVWRLGPGMDLFDTIRCRFGDLPIIAEDLGSLSDAVTTLLRDSGLPGMKVLQFAFDPYGDSEHLPHHHPQNAVVYTGTHDNDTTAGWFAANPAEAAFARRYLRMGAAENPVRPFMQGALASPAAVCVLTVQDLLGLGAEARMNTPSVPEGNWTWRLTALPDAATAAWLRDNTYLYRRGR